MGSWSFVAFVALGLAVALPGCQRAPAPEASAPPSAEGEEPAVDRAQPEDLTPRELRDWRAYVHRFPSPCPQAGHSLAECLAAPSGCAACGPAADFVAASIRAGHVAEQVEGRYLARFDPGRVKVISLDGAPTMGPAQAPVTIVEFADFQCPFCAASFPLVDALVELYAPHVRVAFRHFPIEYHKHSEEAARAAVAAQAQGKFWQMHHAMFNNRTALERTDIEGYARSLGLDMQRFLRDLDSPEVAEHVRGDYQMGSMLEVRGTPTFFINGREFNFDLFDFGSEDLTSWIELEILLATGKPAPKPQSRRAPSTSLRFASIPSP